MFTRHTLSRPIPAKGDVIAIIFGLNTPHVLRRAASGRKEPDRRMFAQLVGDTYVHGIMEGEALEHPNF
jgi:hypothetical protein